VVGSPRKNEEFSLTCGQAGYPMKAVTGTRVDDWKQSQHRYYGMLDFGDFVACYRPIWPGFAINTIFYAAILWLPFAATKVVRRRMRAHRGRCTACGYDLRGRASVNKLC